MESTSDALNFLDEGRWGPLAQHIIDTQKNELWHPDFTSFSDWMAFLSEQFGISRARCWRYRKAGTYYHTLKSKDDSLPELIDLPEYVSAEALEILERLERVAPDRVTEDIKEKVLNGRVSIRTVKKTWEAYRFAMEGQTNRGGNEYVVRAEVKKSSSYQAEAILALSQNKKWSGKTSPARCPVFHNVYDRTKKINYDALSLVQYELDEAVHIHAFEILSQGQLPSGYSFATPDSSIDFEWIVMPDKHAKDYAATEPHKGVIGIGEKTLSIYKTAVRHERPMNSEQTFMRDLIKLALRN